VTTAPKPSPSFQMLAFECLAGKHDACEPGAVAADAGGVAVKQGTRHRLAGHAVGAQAMQDGPGKACGGGEYGVRVLWVAVTATRTTRLLRRHRMDNSKFNALRGLR
jgi:hypothetical protein